MKLLELFSYIMDNTGAGVSGGALALLGFYIFGFVQMGSSMIQALRLYFQILPGSTGEKVMTSAIPFVLLGSVAMFQPLFFGMFTGGAFHEFDYLRQTLSNRQFQVEVLLLFLLYATAALTVRWYTKWRKAARPAPKKLELALAALEIAFMLVLGALCLLSLCFDQNGGGTWSGLLTRNETIMLWTVYGIYLILYKTVVRFFAVIWSAIFIPPPIALDGRDPAEYGDRLVIKEIRRGYAFSCKLTLQFIIMCGYLVYLSLTDSSAKGFLYCFAAALAGGVLWLLGSLLLWLLPKRAAKYKAFAALNNYDMPRFNEEYFGKRFTYENAELWLTKTFLIHKAPFRVQPLRTLPPDQQEWIKYRQNSIGKGDGAFDQHTVS